jgi:hypothetical protein
MIGKTVIEGERLILSPIANQAFFCFLSFLFSFNVFFACFFGFSLLISMLSVINSAADMRFIKKLVGILFMQSDHL